MLFLLNKNVFENVKCQIEFKLNTPHKFSGCKNIKIFIHDFLFLFYFYDWIILQSLVSISTLVIVKMLLLVKNTDVY